MVLEIYPVIEPPQSATSPPSMPSPERVLSLIQNLLPPPSEIFTSEFFKLPLFPVAILYDIAEFYGCHETPEEFTHELSLPSADKKDLSMKTMIWMAYILRCDLESTTQIVNMFKLSRKISPKTFGSATTHESPKELDTRHPASLAKINQKMNPQRDANREIINHPSPLPPSFEVETVHTSHNGNRPPSLENIASQSEQIPAPPTHQKQLPLVYITPEEDRGT